MAKLLRKFWLTLFILIAVLVASCSKAGETTGILPTPSGNSTVRDYTFRVVNTYPHDRTAFTEGLVYEKGIMYEGTGLNGNSTLRKVDLKTGEVLKSYQLADKYFGEGITIYGNSIIQLTWLTHTGFVYDKDSFELLLQFSYPTQGWGLTCDGNRLIMSDGTSSLYFLDPVTFNTTGNVNVRDGNTPIDMLNELEYVQGYVYANIWQTDKIAIIDPLNGRVVAWLDLTGLLPSQYQPVDVLNGIAYDTENSRLFVTGKFWPLLFQIELVPVN